MKLEEPTPLEAFPVPPPEAPPGQRAEVRASDERWWEVVDPETPRADCRRPRCQRSAVAILWRPHGRSRSRWRYCAQHLAEYGRWVEAGRVVHWVLVDEQEGKVGAGIWRLCFAPGDPDRPNLGRLCHMSIELPNGYTSEGRKVWESDLRDLRRLLDGLQLRGDDRVLGDDPRPGGGGP